MTLHKRKLIEVALPLEAINEEGSRRKRKAPAGYPTTLHKWWAQRPIAAARAVIFAQMVDDPSAHPDLFPTEASQEKERQRLFRIIEDLVLWDNTNNETVVQQARDEIWRSWRYTCAENAHHPNAIRFFDRHKLPGFHDPFAGSGALPLEAQRLGLDSYASDLNPVAVLINKAMIEITPRFAGQPPVHPGKLIASKSGKDQGRLFKREWNAAQGLAEDVRYYGQWMRDEAERRIGHLYPKIEVTDDMVDDPVNPRPDLKLYLGQKLTVVAWLWARTVKSPNPAFGDVDVPLVSTFMLSTKVGKEAYVEPLVKGSDYRFTVKVGKPTDAEGSKLGTTVGKRAAFRCLMSGVPVTYDHIRQEGKAGRMGARLMAIVAEGKRGRIFLSPTNDSEDIALTLQPTWKPETTLPLNPRDFKTPNYGLTSFADLFTARQLIALTTFADLVAEVNALVKYDALAAGLPDNQLTLQDGGAGPAAYAEAVCTYLAMALSRLADYGSSIATWRPKDNAMRSTMPKQAVQMAWDYAEGSPFGDSSSGFLACVQVVAKVINIALTGGFGSASQASVQDVVLAKDGGAVVSTDPPYYDNISYADLSDFFYVWLRHSLKPFYPDLFATLAVPKAEELVATPYRHGSKEEAETFFLKGMTLAMHRLAEQAHPAFPVTIYYAFRQSESKSDLGTASTGWETFLDAVVRAGFAITGTWPMRTEGDNRQMGIGNNALASSIVLVCRKRSAVAPIATRREFITALKTELPAALAHLQRGNIAPVDLAQAAIGPGMAVYTRYAQVLDAEGKPLPVRAALTLINQTLDEALAAQEGDFDADTRWALTWFEQMAFNEGEYGVAEQLSKSKNTSVAGLQQAGILVSKAGKVRLLKPAEFPVDWDPTTDKRLTVWEMVHQLIRALESGGDTAAAALVAKLGSKSETARELCYRLYTLCERKKRANEAMAYNALVQSWPEIARLAREIGSTTPQGTGDLFDAPLS
ncbi:DUF1156 domain-containing protein [Thiocapsa sp. UBA6158]|uniref:DUF1156 domain-containing protein n=1 Tax=Thiocapsa sp. UBA6158 TaxID=1947692 RepID=UPI0025CF9792|nr:DUF1156 domain-containing protein [Thiocapsa sp. UBA6158]